MAGELNKRVAVITGAGSGIGQATAWLMAERGARLMIQDIDRLGADKTAQGVHARGGDAVVHVSDVADPAANRDLIRSAEEKFGQVDILINNAGIGIDRRLEDIDESAFDRMLAVHVKGSFFMAKAAVAGMKRRRYGRIVNVSSRWAMAGHELASDYVAAKSALLGLTKAWAKEFASFDITVNAVAPGGVKTAMVERTLGPQGIVAEEKLVPLGRWCEPREIAGAIAFLASDQASFITGQTISPNGGKTIASF